MFDFSDKVALVTGAGSGIGKATSIAFGKAGAKVIVADINFDSANATRDAIESEGGDVLSVSVDVSQLSSVKEMINAVVEKHHRLDCAFNNAGIMGDYSSLMDCSEANWDRVINVNLKGTFLCMKFQLQVMSKQKSGSIVNMSSIAGLVGYDGMLPAYAPSKHGVIGLTKTAALEYAKQGIRINAVCPGDIETPMQDEYARQLPSPVSYEPDVQNIGRIGSPEEVADAVLWLTSDSASFITGHSLAIDGGYTAQ